MSKHRPSGDYGFKSLLNFRDIGGVPAADNSMIKKGVVFRSANPDKLSKGDTERISSLNIRTIIDLRASREVRKKYVPVDHTERLSLPLDFQQTTTERLRPFIFRKDANEIIADISNEIYLEILDASCPVFGKVMQTLASPGLSPVLIHCQAGKDRTGIISAWYCLLWVWTER